MIKGVDLSEWNDNSTIAEMKNAGQQFAILRGAGTYRGKQASVSIGYIYKDAHFNAFYDQAKRLNFPIGAYYYSTAGTAADGRAERQFFYDNCLKGRKFEYPVYIDIEVTPKKYRKANTGAAVAFCEEMEKHRYYTGIYGSDINTFKEMLIYDLVTQYTLWVARYGKKPEYVKQYAMWQYTSKGAIVGIKGNVDRDECYTDFPKIMKGVHLNGY